MTGLAIQQMADRIAALMEDRLGTRGRGLAEKLRRDGRRLPRKVRAAATLLARAEGLAGHPRLAAQNDPQALAEAYDTCHAYLAPLGRWQRRRAVAEGVALSILVSLALLALLVAALLHWRGYL